MNNLIKIGIIGMGAMGKGLLFQSKITKGMECFAVCDLKMDRCIESLEEFKIDYKVVNNLKQMNQAIDSGQVAVCNNGRLIAECDFLDVVVEASSSIKDAILNVITALDTKKHVVLMNSEIDLLFGPYLKSVAEKNDVVCTSIDGDQYGVIKHLLDDLVMWGFDLVMAGNIKGYLDRYANPTTIIDEAEKRNLDNRMCVSYTDGTKLNIEMAIISNAYGLASKTPGMSGPRTEHVSDVLQIFNLERLWKGKKAFVDYILGAEPGGGVFAVGYCDNYYQQEMLSYYKMGSGPFYLFYRPYHLCHIESMTSIIGAGYGKCLLKPEYGLQTNVFAYAKRDMMQGDILDGIGGYTCYGLIENCDQNCLKPGLPICLSEGVELKRKISKDEKIYMSAINYDQNRIDFILYEKALKESEKVKQTLKGQ